MSELLNVRKLSGVFEVELDGMAYALKPTQKDKWELQTLLFETKPKNLFEQVDGVLKNILKNTDPTLTDSEIEAFLLKYTEPMLKELAIAFNWSKREVITKAISDFEKKILENALEKTSGENS